MFWRIRCFVCGFCQKVNGLWMFNSFTFGHMQNPCTLSGNPEGIEGNVGCGEKMVFWKKGSVKCKLLGELTCPSVRQFLSKSGMITSSLMSWHQRRTRKKKNAKNWRKRNSGNFRWVTQIIRRRLSHFFCLIASLGCFVMGTVNPEYFVCTKFSYPWDPRPFVRTKFSYSRWPLRILWLALDF